MSNTYGISPEDEKRVRARDKACVYCHVQMKAFSTAKGSRTAMATIEHMHNGEPWDAFWNLAMCCWSCNGSKGVKSLTKWFLSDYCKRKRITEESVAQIVREFMKAKPQLA